MTDHVDWSIALLTLSKPPPSDPSHHPFFFSFILSLLSLLSTFPVSNKLSLSSFVFGLCSSSSDIINSFLLLATHQYLHQIIIHSSFYHSLVHSFLSPVLFPHNPIAHHVVGQVPNAYWPQSSLVKLAAGPPFLRIPVEKEREIIIKRKEKEKKRWMVTGQKRQKVKSTS
jgi:hypothetical protein